MPRVFKSVAMPLFTLFVLSFTFFLTASVQAANVCVDDSSDGAAIPANCDATCTDGTPNCSLRDAIAAASADDHIIFAPALSGQTINLTGSALTITTALSIDGPGSADLTISGQDAVRIFNVQANVGISGLSMAHGRSSTSGACIWNTGSLTLDGVDIGHCEINSNSFQSGIGIFNDNATLTISNTTIHDNQPTAGATGGMSGGGIASIGTLQMDHSTVRNNTAVGQGGIYGLGNLTLSDVTIADNTSTGGVSFSGGGLLVTSIGNSQLTNVTISGNQITGGGASGGGLAITDNASPTLTNVTIGNNSVTGPNSRGGGVFVSNVGNPITMTNVTVVENSATSGGNLFLQDGGILTLKNVILANVASGGDCSFDNGIAPTNGGGNLVEDGSCGFAAGGDPNLGPLQNNGGATLTYALQSPSPAIDTGTDAGCPATDQRGVTRPQGSHCDIGAVEFTPAPTVDSTIEDLKDLVSGLPPSAFNNGSMGATLLNKIAALKGSGNGTKNKLLNDILPKGDGCGTAPDKNDWITNCADQAEFQAAVQAILALL